MLLFPRKPRRHGVELQLTAMIDIFSMIVIFLIFGTVFGASDIVIPPDMKIPKSASREGLDTAPRIIIDKDKVRVSIWDGAVYPLEGFHGGDGSAQVRTLRSRLKAYVAELPEGSKRTGLMLNVIADKNAEYRDIFDVVKVFRSEGFESLLFVAMGEGPGNVEGISQ